jgi:hypothetical protein
MDKRPEEIRAASFLINNDEGFVSIVRIACMVLGNRVVMDCFILATP